MKYSKLIEKYREIDSICYQYDIKKFRINKDFSINVNGNVNLSNRNLNIIPIKFNIVCGDFICSDNILTNLKNSPIYLEGNYICSNNKLSTLHGCTSEIEGYFNCSDNNLKVLTYAPTYVKKNVYISDNQLPRLIMNNKHRIKEIFKNQDEYGIWNNDETLNEYRFNIMMEELD